MEILSIPNSLENLELIVTPKYDTKKTEFFMSSYKSLVKDGIQDNNWVGHRVLEPVDVVAFNKIKALREVNNYKQNYFELYILDEGALDKVS